MKPLLATASLLIFAVASNVADAARYNSNFNNFSQAPEAQSFTDDKTYPVITYSGGWAGDVTDQELYRSGRRAWVVDPNGIGGSSGIGLITFSEDLCGASGWIRSEAPNGTGYVEVLFADASSQIFHSRTDDWTQFDVNHCQNSATKITRVRYFNTGSSGATAMEDVVFVTPEPLTSSGSNSGGGSAAPALLALLATLGWGFRRTVRMVVRTRLGLN